LLRGDSGKMPAAERQIHSPNPEMALSLSDVRRIAHLARLEITDTEAQETLAQMINIFQLIEQLQSVDTATIEPMSHPIGATQRLRNDQVTEPDRREANMQNAPARQDGLFLVPRVIE
jgi:aspartyl-tRNA(Asn)/glutamyl-tRNA(Gln) amidotransferase subunit C